MAPDDGSALTAVHPRLADLGDVLRVVADGITIQDASGRLVWANDAAARLIGFPDAETLLVTSVAEILDRFDVLDETHTPLPLEQLPGRLALAGVEAPERLVCYRIRETGEERWSVVRATPVRREDGEVELAINIFQDVTDRKRAEDRFHFLADASVILASSLDYETTLASVARLAVPQLADWCIVYIRSEDGSIRRLALEHSGDRALEVAAVLDRYPLDPDAQEGVPAVIRTGEPILRATAAHRDVVADVTDPEDLERALGDLVVSSYLCVPLTARGRTIGAISLLEGEGGRQFGQADLELAEELARRAALAVDNALLYRAAERRGEQLRRLSDVALAAASTPVNQLLARLGEEARWIVGAEQAEIELGEGTSLEPREGQAAAPLVGRDGSTLGRLYLTGKLGGEQFTDEDHAIVVQLAQLASAAVENSRLAGETAHSLALLDAVLASAPVGVGFWDRDLRYVRVNQALARLNRLPADEHVGKTLREVVPEFADVLEPIYRRVIETGEPFVQEESTEMLAPRLGTDRHWLSSYYPVRTPHGEVIGLGAVIMEITERKRAEGRMRFLGEASRILAASLDYEDALRSVADLAVTGFADWAQVLLAEDGGIRRIVVSHPDPQKDAVVRALAEAHPTVLTEKNPLRTVLNDGVSVLLESVGDEVLRSAAHDDEHFAVLRELGLTSAMLVPITASGHVVGALALALSEPGRAYDTDDLAFVEELGRRVGLAIENARLYRAAQEAITLFEAQREASIDGVLVVGPDGRILSYNRRFAELWGLPDDALGTDEAALASAIHRVVDPDGFLQRVRQVYENPVPSYEELLLVDGRVIERHGAPVRAEDGTYYGYLWSFRDVTERKRSVEELEKLGSLVEASDEFIAMADLDGRMIYLNEAGRRLVGLERELTETTVEDYATSETWRLWAQEGLPAAREHGSWGGRWTIRHQGTGEPIDVEGTVFVVRHPETRRALAFATVQRDIRERIRAETELAARARGAQALQFVGDGVVLVDGDGVVRLWNPVAASVTGLRADEVEGRPAAEAIPGWKRLVERVPIVPPERGHVARSETLPLEIDGRELWLSVSGVDFGEGTVFAFRDVTEERGLEQLKSDFVSTVSHELRTPLAAIYGAALTLRRADMPLPDDQRGQLLGVIADEADRLARIVNDILWTSRIESGGLHVQLESCDAARLAAAVVQAARIHRPESVTIELDAAGDLPYVAADPDKVRQVLANLLDNAVKYSPDGGRIDIRLVRSDGRVRFLVSDEGLGIPVAERERIFEKFYRLDPDLTRGVGGTGLGLYICRELVRRMDGWIWVEPNEPRGSTFVVELQAVDEIAAHTNL